MVVSAIAVGRGREIMEKQQSFYAVLGCAVDAMTHGERRHESRLAEQTRQVFDSLSMTATITFSV